MLEATSSCLRQDMSPAGPDPQLGRSVGEMVKSSCTEEVSEIADHTPPLLALELPCRMHLLMRSMRSLDDAWMDGLV